MEAASRPELYHLYKRRAIKSTRRKRIIGITVGFVVAENKLHYCEYCDDNYPVGQAGLSRK